LVGQNYFSIHLQYSKKFSISREISGYPWVQPVKNKLREVMTPSGFTRFHRETEMPFDLILKTQR